MATLRTAKEALFHWGLKTQRCTVAQQRLASTLGLPLESNLPALVAAARLKNALSSELLSEQASPTESQLDYLASLNAKSLHKAVESADRGETDAWILYEQLRRRKIALAALGLKQGDIVEVTSGSGVRRGEVASFKEDGRIYFKGGLGAGAWPDEIRIQFSMSISRHPTARGPRDTCLGNDPSAIRK
jgi:hypothetical protein